MEVTSLKVKLLLSPLPVMRRGKRLPKGEDSRPRDVLNKEQKRISQDRSTQQRSDPNRNGSVVTSTKTLNSPHPPRSFGTDSVKGEETVESPLGVEVSHGVTKRSSRGPKSDVLFLLERLEKGKDGKEQLYTNSSSTTPRYSIYNKSLFLCSYGSSPNFRGYGDPTKVPEQDIGLKGFEPGGVSVRGTEPGVGTRRTRDPGKRCDREQRYEKEVSRGIGGPLLFIYH